MKAAERYREYTSRHTSTPIAHLSDSRKAPRRAICWRLTAFISQKVFRLSKNKESGL